MIIAELENVCWPPEFVPVSVEDETDGRAKVGKLGALWDILAP
jgi:hypothetical protein